MKELKTTSGGKERIEAASILLSSAFKHDPTITYFLSSKSPSERDRLRPRLFKDILTTATLNHGTIQEVNDWESCGVLLPPGCRVDRYAALLPAVGQIVPDLIKLGAANCKRLFIDFPALVHAAKKDALQGMEEKYYFVLFLGTLEAGRGKGLCSAIVRQYQKVAAKENVPVYLEAATEYVRNLYESLGFHTLKEFVVGKGKHSIDGTLCDGGTGFKLWCMIWRPS